MTHATDRQTSHDRPLRIVASAEAFSRVRLVAPTSSGFLHLAAEVDRRPPFLWASRTKRKLLGELKRLCDHLKREPGVREAHVFRAILVPPGGRGRFARRLAGRVHVARFDVAVLIETDTVERARRLRRSPAYAEVEARLRAAARYVHVMTASNVRRIGPVNHDRNGVFLFNYFFADDVRQNLAVWEYTAGWFQQETGLDNSTVLLPDDPAQSQYTIVNHCRWDALGDVLPSLLFKRSFRRFVLANFEANNTAPMPILYRLA